ncbi:MAG: type 4a pilus biogenesis protein PilO [Phycisphaerae bacterium]|nr:type 4a pilus biogenesis protein PilO [Phycisphaerae bacterium]MDD5381252.1 type 4a pilus biogenesis protein PilO [Phycisphaerae bacterium]
MIRFREKRQIAIFAAAAVMICGFVLFRYLPLKRETEFLRQAYALRMLAVSKALDESRQMPAAREELLGLRAAVGNYERQIPARRELGEFMQKITDLMNEHNLKGQMIQPGKEVRAGDLNCVPVNMQCKGRLSQIFEFYREVQGLDRLVRIERVKLVNDNDFGGEVVVQTNAVIYYRAEAGQG